MIVGIGASAGGIQTLQAFFQVLPDSTGAAFVVIVHLDPESRSDLAGILAARTPMPVVQVGATETLQPRSIRSINTYAVGNLLQAPECGPLVAN